MITLLVLCKLSCMWDLIDYRVFCLCKMRSCKVNADKSTVMVLGGKKGSMFENHCLGVC